MNEDTGQANTPARKHDVAHQVTSESGIDDFQASRSPDDSHRTAPLRGLFAHMKSGFYHDGRLASLIDVVNHYNDFKRLNLTDQEKRELN